MNDLPRSHGRPKDRGANDSGAVMVESLIAIPMLLTFFAMMVQLSYVSMASLVVQHAAVVAARSASVLIEDLPDAFDGSAVGSADGERLAAITDAANTAILPLLSLPPLSTQSNPFNPTAKVTLMKDGSPATDFDADEVVQARVEYAFKCAVFFGGSFICGPSQSITITAQAALPLQGAEYGYY